jgi:hypothetical protein
LPAELEIVVELAEESVATSSGVSSQSALFEPAAPVAAAIASLLGLGLSPDDAPASEEAPEVSTKLQKRDRCETENELGECLSHRSSDLFFYLNWNLVRAARLNSS